VSGTPTKLTQSSLRLSHSPYTQPHPSGLPRSPFQARTMPRLSAVPGNPSSPGPSGHPGSGTDTGAAADSGSQAGNVEEEEGVPIALSYGGLHGSMATVDDEICCTSHSLWLVFFVDLVVIGLLYMAYPNKCQHKGTFLPRLRPYPMRGHWLL
jgi:hypothetical protein